jgi:hypothetical protein
MMRASLRAFAVVVTFWVGSAFANPYYPPAVDTPTLDSESQAIALALASGNDVLSVTDDVLFANATSNSFWIPLDFLAVNLSLGPEVDVVSNSLYNITFGNAQLDLGTNFWNHFSVAINFAQGSIFQSVNGVVIASRSFSPGALQNLAATLFGIGVIPNVSIENGSDVVAVASTPEPSSLMLMCVGLLIGIGCLYVKSRSSELQA